MLKMGGNAADAVSISVSLGPRLNGVPPTVR
jgi:hypothetical protein